MCNWAIIQRHGKKPTAKSIVEYWLTSCEGTTNKDAAGIAAIHSDDGVCHTLRDGRTPSELIASGTWEKFYRQYGDADTWMLHARKATQGSPRCRYNNHPHYANGHILVHQGVLSDLPLHDKQRGESDSEAALWAIVDGGLEAAFDWKGSYKLGLYAPGQGVLVYSDTATGLDRLALSTMTLVTTLSVKDAKRVAQDTWETLREGKEVSKKPLVTTTGRVCAEAKCKTVVYGQDKWLCAQHRHNKSIAIG